MSPNGKDASIAIIPARGGSKRIPKKNIKLFAGSPIIRYSIEAALNSGIFQEVMVSTDDSEIAEVAKKYGAKVPFFRSAKNSDDHAMTADVIKEVIEQYQSLGIFFQYLCCIYPTAPFITPNKLLAAKSLLHEKNADCVLPVVKFSYPVQRSVKIENGKIVMNWPEHYNKRSQDLPPIYHDCGQFYFFKTERLLTTMRLFTDNTCPLVVPDTEAQDIDNEDDWKIAEIKYKLFIK
jgi:N-acylneuraminate cytidylyltransferase